MSFKLSSISTESGASSSSKLSKNYPKTVKYRSGHHHHRHRYEEPKHERIVRRSSSESSTLSKSSSNVSYRCVTTVGKSFVSRCIGVFGMNIFTKKKYIFELFSKFGPIENFNFITDARTGLFRGFCFIYYISTDDAKLAKKTLNGIDIDGRKIRVDYSFTQRPHSPTPGLYMGRCTKQLNSLYSKPVSHKNPEHHRFKRHCCCCRSRYPTQIRELSYRYSYSNRHRHRRRTRSRS
ncbi:transformer-2 sex-determining protein-like isoform X2 [Teleopsis dalmanni]|uniref:transformer-2 sex-determining protein-like isoform X2 n=1 Tax=Teleopsis dalmanni TaxID=139649 RepID=UPI0018CFD688|nr:transformer-2 sex-determining protein-like isoform X2 [Teleopsis dalmanni]